MKRFFVALVLTVVGFAAFAETTSEGAMERARAKRDAAWNEYYNCHMMSLEEFTAEYKKNHFALSIVCDDWSPSLSKAFKEYQEEVIQKQKELKAAFEEADAKYEEAEQAWMDELNRQAQEGRDECEEAVQAWIDKLNAVLEEYKEE